MELRHSANHIVFYIVFLLVVQNSDEIVYRGAWESVETIYDVWKKVQKFST